MKRSITFSCLYLLLSVLVPKIYSQTHLSLSYYDTIAEIKSIKPVFPSADNFIFSKTDFHWKPKTSLIFLDYAWQAGNFSMQANMLSLNYRFFNFTLLSVLQNDEIDNKDAYFYLLPFGLKCPLVSDKYFTMSLGSTFYLLPSENAINANNDGKIYSFARFIDNQIRFETNLVLGASFYFGHRIQLSQFSTSDENGKLIYEGRSVSGPYAGISFSLEVLFPVKPNYWGRCYNPGVDEFSKTIKLNNVSQYEDFIENYPKGIYSDLATENLNTLLRIDSIWIETAKKADEKIIPGISVEEVISVLRMDKIVNASKTYYVGMGLFPDNENEKSKYTGKLSLDGFDMTFENGKMVSKDINVEKMGSRKVEVQYKL